MNFCLNGGDKDFIVISRYGAIWKNNQQKFKLVFNKMSR